MESAPLVGIHTCAHTDGSAVTGNTRATCRVQAELLCGMVCVLAIVVPPAVSADITVSPSTEYPVKLEKHFRSNPKAD